MSLFSVPTRESVTESNQAIFDQLQRGLGFVPNLYATFAHSRTALGTYLALQNAKSSLRAREREAINLAVSQVNECAYCLAAHTALGKAQGFTDEQILDLRQGRAPWNDKLDALAAFARQTTEQRGKPSTETVQALLDAGYDRGNVVDAIVIIGDKIISNYLHGITQIPVDFPAAAALETAAA